MIQVRTTRNHSHDPRSLVSHPKFKSRERHRQRTDRRRDIIISADRNHSCISDKHRMSRCVFVNALELNTVCSIERYIYIYIHGKSSFCARILQPQTCNFHICLFPFLFFSYIYNSQSADKVKYMLSSSAEMEIHSQL